MQRAGRPFLLWRNVLHREIVKAHVGSLGQAPFALVKADLLPPALLLSYLLVELVTVGLLLLHFRGILMGVGRQASELLLYHFGIDGLGRPKLLGLTWGDVLVAVASVAQEAIDWHLHIVISIPDQ